jgi:hypothetical protein
VASVLEVAKNLFGGFLGKAVEAGEQVRSASWKSLRDHALTEALQEIKPHFTKVRSRS